MPKKNTKTKPTKPNVAFAILATDEFLAEIRKETGKLFR